jgi:hypothetical protein
VKHRHHRSSSTSCRAAQLKLHPLLLAPADEDLLMQELRAGVLKPSYLLVRYNPCCCCLCAGW